MRVRVKGDINAARLEGVKKLNAAARDLVRVFVSDGFDTIYAEKVRQAREVIARPALAQATSADRAFISRDAARSGQTLLEASEAILLKAEKWNEQAAGIDELRRTAKAKIENAKTRLEIEHAVAGVNLAALFATLEKINQ